MTTGETFAKYEVFEDFQGVVAPDATSFALGIVDVGTGVYAYTTDEPGGVLNLQTGTTDNNNAGLTVGGFQPSLGPCVLEVRGKPVALANQSFFIGFSNVMDATTPVMPFEYATTTLTSNSADGVGFLYDVDATTDVLRVAAVDSDVDTLNAAAGEPTALAADTYIVYRVEMDPTGEARLYADGEQVARQTAAVTPTVVYFASVLVETRAAAAINFEVDYFYASGYRSAGN